MAIWRPTHSRWRAGTSINTRIGSQNQFSRLPNTRGSFCFHRQAEHLLSESPRPGTQAVAPRGGGRRGTAASGPRHRAAALTSCPEAAGASNSFFFAKTSGARFMASRSLTALPRQPGARAATRRQGWGRGPCFHRARARGRAEGPRELGQASPMGVVRSTL